MKALNLRISRRAMPEVCGVVERAGGWRTRLFLSLLFVFVVCTINPDAAMEAQSSRQPQKADQWKILRPPADASPKSWIEFYRKWLERYPKDREALKGVAYQESQLNQRKAAIQDYQHVLEIYPDDRDSRLELARLLSFDHQYDAALKEYCLLLTRNPQDPAALLGKARISFYRGKLQEAHTMATEVVEKQPNDFSSVFLLASIEHAQHHRRETLRLLNHAEKLSPGNAEVASLRNRVLAETRVTLTTTAAYTREIPAGPPAAAAYLTKTCGCTPTTPRLQWTYSLQRPPTFLLRQLPVTVLRGRYVTAMAIRFRLESLVPPPPTIFFTGSPHDSATC